MNDSKKEEQPQKQIAVESMKDQKDETSLHRVSTEASFSKEISDTDDPVSSSTGMEPAEDLVLAQSSEHQETSTPDQSNEAFIFAHKDALIVKEDPHNPEPNFLLPSLNQEDHEMRNQGMETKNAEGNPNAVPAYPLSTGIVVPVVSPSSVNEVNQNPSTSPGEEIDLMLDHAKTISQSLTDIFDSRITSPFCQLSAETQQDLSQFYRLLQLPMKEVAEKYFAEFKACVRRLVQKKVFALKEHTMLVHFWEYLFQNLLIQ